jgi:uncharacterized protein (TIGR03032 family)
LSFDADTCPTGAAEDGPAPLQTDSPAAYSFSSGLLERLAGLGISLAFTSYQSGLLYMLGADPGHGPQLHQSAVGKPMGIATDGRDGLVLAGANAITRYRNVLKPGERINHVFDACYMPRETWLTGGLDAHDVAVDTDGRVIFVNTAFNCLAMLSPTHSFTPLWRPPFISALVNEDRCHLNGLAMAGGRPAFVTAVSRSDTIDGWRDRRDGGGVVIDVRSNEIVSTGLCMPHSPRVHRGRLWLLNSGTGELGHVADTGRFEPLAFCPGFVRGLACHDNLAFVALSKPRYARFEGLPLDRRLGETDSDPWCGIQVIDLDSGTCVDWFRIDGGVTEIYDVAVIGGRACPMAVSPGSADAFTLITIDDASAGRIGNQ